MLTFGFVERNLTVNKGDKNLTGNLLGFVRPGQRKNEHGDLLSSLLDKLPTQRQTMANGD